MKSAPEGSSCLIRRARLIDPSTETDAIRDVLMLCGRVAMIAASIEPGSGALRPDTVIEAEGLWLWPGLVDVHVHFRDPGFTHKETLASGSAAALCGGYTSVVCEPNTEPPIDSVDMARGLADRAREEGLVHIYFKAAMTRGRQGREVADVAALSQEPSVVALSDDGDPIADLALMDDICTEAAKHDVLLSPHCEDSARAISAFQSGASPGFKPGMPFTNESAYIERDATLALHAGCRVHFSHVSLARSIKAIRAAKRSGAKVTFEVAPHHLLLNAEDYPEGSAPRVNPPLRSTADRAAVQDALLNGAADVIASDHAPHGAEDVARGATGLVGLETTLGLVLTYFVHTGRLPALDAARAMSARPAEIFGLPAGSLKPGAQADAVLIDPAEEWTVRAASFASLSRNTPFEGRNLKGRVMAVIVGGRLAFQRDSVSSRISSR